ncbi:hypothetical protein BT96DRAFT_1057866 [Gymnopus androsaceus JB14]|uniref:CHAT domain-containing protein n=1 Tax=Gymnopus androsaceus JB14 TaxID=1447944 RepID=A0A6A4I8A7_9AGAR|nr:hypothetical protein BT96DRAFT_1057866 [Gymnopus androsaceus JB14]
MPNSVRLALMLSTLPSDMFDQVLAQMAVLPWDIWDDDATVDEQLVVQSMNERLSKMSPQDMVETSALAIREFKARGNLNDLNQGIGLLRNAIDGFTKSGDTKGLFDALRRLTGCLTLSFERTGDANDLSGAIQSMQKAVELSLDDSERAQAFYTIGQMLSQRFTLLKGQDDLIHSLESFIKGLSILPDDEMERHGLLFFQDIANSMKTSIQYMPVFNKFKDMFVKGTTSPSLSSFMRSRILTRLGSELFDQFETHGRMEDLEEALSTLKSSVELDSTDAEAMSIYGVCQLVHFEQRGDSDNLAAAVATQRKCVELLDPDSEQLPGVLNNLGNALQVQFEHLGKVADLDEAVNVHQRALYHLKVNTLKKEAKFTFHRSLGVAYHRRFEHLEDIQDLDSAVNQLEMAVSTAPDGHPSEAQILAAYGNVLCQYFNVSGQTSLLQKSIEVQRQAVLLTALDHPARPLRLVNLSGTIQDLPSFGTEIQPIDEAIVIVEEAISLLGDYSPLRALAMFRLSSALTRRYEVNKTELGEISLKDLDRAIETGRCAIQTLPRGHELDLPKLCFGLATCLLFRYHSLNKVESDRNEALSILEKGSKCPSKPVAHQFICAIKSAQLCAEVHGVQAGIMAFKAVFKLIPDVVWIGNSLDRRYRDTELIRSFLSEAVALAIKANDIRLALEWSEEGRCIVWGQILQLRQPVSSDEVLAKEFSQVTSKLQSLESKPVMKSNINMVTQLMAAVAQAVNRDQPVPIPGISQEEFAHRLAAFAVGVHDHGKQEQRRLAEKLAEQAQSVPGGYKFQHSKDFSTLLTAAQGGPIVFINICSEQCDAVAITPWQMEPILIPLKTFSEMKAVEMMTTFISDLEEKKVRTKSRGVPQSTVTGRLWTILASLWTDVVHPVLTSFGDQPPLQLHNQSNGKPLHITWCPSGALTFLPLHAAGIYKSSGGKKLFDYAVSSYTPSITALLSSQEHHHDSPHQTSSAPRLLAISQPNTPNAEELPSTVKEVEILQSIHPNLTWLNDTEGTKDAVLKGIEEHDWVHFACHSEMDMEHPLKSAFLLQDKNLQLVDLLMKPLSHTQLAYLSACRTAASNGNIPDEAVHLAAGMLMAGFQDVVATLWAIGDDDATFVAEHFYRYLKEEGDGDSTQSSYALHYAVGKMRESIGEKNFLRWIPFIHLGI